MTVAELTNLRSLLRSSSLEYSVVKNTLAKIASQNTVMAVATDSLKGPVGIAIGYDDPVLVLKKVLEFKKTNEKLQVKGAVVEGKFCDPNVVKEIAALPSREILLSMLAGAFQSPLSTLAGALNATVATFAYAMESLKSTKNN